MTIAAGTKLGRYEIRSKIGEGGMGEVYNARDEKLNRSVAIKVLPASLSQNADRLRRFEQEAQAAGALNHPNILAVYDVGAHEGSPYVVSELLEGETLRERLGKRLGMHSSGVPLAQRKAVDYAVQLAHGLAAAHEKGIIHRDLKPDNIFITKDDRVKILDFGVAKLIEPVNENLAQTDIATRKVQTDPGTVLGTVGYMSPEQVRGKHVDHRSDIFSFGAVLYEMLSGQRAFRGESAVETLNAILKEEPRELTATNRNIAPALERVVWHCFEKSPKVILPLLSIPQEMSDVDMARTLIGSKTLAVWQPSLSDLRVLVVDDEPDARELIAAVLTGRSAEVVSVESAGEALEEMERQRFDVLVSDIGMPLMDGYALIEKIRQLPAERGGRIPAAALTAYAGVEDRMRVLSAGYQIHIPKPVEPAELTTVVANLAERYAKPLAI